jgi:hypothetical protein
LSTYDFSKCLCLNENRETAIRGEERRNERSAGSSAALDQAIAKSRLLTASAGGGG